MQVYSTFKAKEEIHYKPKQTSYDQTNILPLVGFANPWTIIIEEAVPKFPGAYIGLLVLKSSFTEDMLENSKKNLLPLHQMITSPRIFKPVTVLTILWTSFGPLKTLATGH